MDKFLFKKLAIRRAILDDDYETFKSIINEFDGEIIDPLFKMIKDALEKSTVKYFMYMMYNCRWSQKTMNDVVNDSLKEINKSEYNINIITDLILNPYLSEFNRDRLIKNINLEKFPNCKDKVQKMYDTMIPDSRYSITLSMYNYALKNGINIDPLQLSKNRNVYSIVLEQFKPNELNWYYVSSHRLNREFLIKYKEFVIFEIFIVYNNRNRHYVAIDEYRSAYAKVRMYKKNRQLECLMNEIYCEYSGNNPITTKCGVSDYYIDTNCQTMTKEDLFFILKYYQLSSARKSKLQSLYDKLVQVTPESPDEPSTDKPEETPDTPSQGDNPETPSTDNPEESGSSSQDTPESSESQSTDKPEDTKTE